MKKSVTLLLLLLCTCLIFTSCVMVQTYDTNGNDKSDEGDIEKNKPGESDTNSTKDTSTVATIPQPNEDKNTPETTNLDFFPLSDGTYGVKIGKSLYLEEIVIPTTYNNKAVTAIMESGFAGAINLKKITISNSITTVNNGAFAGCKNLVDVNIANHVTNIGKAAFSGCSSLTNITIPKCVANIGELVFEDCNNLERIEVDENNPYYCSVDGILYDKPITKIISIPESISGSIEIPEGVTSIGERSTMMHLDTPSFFNCKITSITIPKSVTCIGELAFSHCKSLTNITIPDSVTYIGVEAFSYCTSLVNITIPDNAIVDFAAFSNCTSLANITIPNSMSEIPGCMFSDCTNLTSITIPDSVTYIWDSAFFNCTSLKTVYYTGTAKEWETIRIDGNNDYLTSATRYYL